MLFFDNDLIDFRYDNDVKIPPNSLPALFFYLAINVMS